LIEQCIKGDRKAFESLLEQYQKPVYNAAFRMLHNPEDARDVTQTVFLKVYENLGSFDTSRRFFSWIYRITLNESINWLEKAGRLKPLEHEAADETGGPERQASNAELGKGIEAALMTITPDYRAVIVLKHLMGCSYVEISEILEIPEKKVKSRLFTARQQLKDELTRTGMH
jgi:RNA polymerase sigma-70 factor (ECF subfamily)